MWGKNNGNIPNGAQDMRAKPNRSVRINPVVDRFRPNNWHFDYAKRPGSGLLSGLISKIKGR